MNTSPGKKVLKIKKRLNLRKGSRESDESLLSSTRSRNSFLVEIEHNKDIEWKVRKDIEEKFRRSNVNAQYVFPRICVGGEGNLPKIKGERRHVSQMDSSLNEAGMTILSLGLGDQGGTARVGRMPNLIKRSANFEKRAGFNSATPSLYFRDVKKSKGGQGIKRSTPSPVPQWKVMGNDKKRLL